MSQLECLLKSPDLIINGFPPSQIYVYKMCQSFKRIDYNKQSSRKDTRIYFYLISHLTFFAVSKRKLSDCLNASNKGTFAGTWYLVGSLQLLISMLYPCGRCECHVWACALFVCRETRERYGVSYYITLSLIPWRQTSHWVWIREAPLIFLSPPLIALGLQEFAWPSLDILWVLGIWRSWFFFFLLSHLPRPSCEYFLWVFLFPS